MRDPKRNTTFVASRRADLGKYLSPHVGAALSFVAREVRIGICEAMTDTPNLALPYILAAQSQKHVTHNEAIRALDCVVQLSVASRTLTAPPGSPAEGSRYVVAAAATGDWTGQSGKIAAFQDGAWAFHAPNEGWIAWVAAESLAIVYTASAWALLPANGLVTDHGMLSGLGDDDHAQYHTDARGDARYTPLDPAMLGINATADTTNRLALQSAASLFDNVGNGHQQKINKHAAGDTASQLYQTNYSGRAEIGLTGDDDFHFKVSANGSTWTEAFKIDKSSGLLSLLSGQMKFPATQIPSSDVNTLDDYEEGTFTPVVQGGTSAGTCSYTLQQGSYVKIGKAVLCFLRVIWASHTGTGDLQITGLPFTPNASIAANMRFGSLTYTDQTQAFFVNGATRIQLETVASTAGAATLQMDAAADINIMGVYFV